MHIYASSITLEAGGTLAFGDIPDISVSFADLLSIGQSVQFHSPYNPPSGRWLYCDGSSIGSETSSATHKGITYYHLWVHLRVANNLTHSNEDWISGELALLPIQYYFDPTTKQLTVKSNAYIGY